jgi:chromosome segregation ATPase
MSSIDELLARNRELIDGFSQEQQRAAPTYEELETERNKLLEQVLTLLKEQMESADNVRYIESLEVRLKRTGKQLQEEKSKREKNEKRSAQLEKSLGEANDSLQHTALAAKMYQAMNQDTNEAEGSFG